MASKSRIQGDCYNCRYYDSYQNYCSYYKIILNANGYEPTCNLK